MRWRNEEEEEAMGNREKRKRKRRNSRKLSRGKVNTKSTRGNEKTRFKGKAKVVVRKGYTKNMVEGGKWMDTCL